MKRQIIITAIDLERLTKLIADEKEFGTSRESAELLSLERELLRSTVVGSKELPAGVITMNSTFVLKDLSTDELITYTLVYPENADFLSNKISIVAPIGTAVLGYSEGQTFQWQVPDGIVTYSVEKVVYQPEAAGDFDL